MATLLLSRLKRTMLFALFQTTGAAQTAPSNVLALETYYVTDRKPVLATISVAEEATAGPWEEQTAVAADTLGAHAEASRCRPANCARVARLRAVIRHGFSRDKARWPNRGPKRGATQHLGGMCSFQTVLRGSTGMHGRAGRDAQRNRRAAWHRCDATYSCQ